MVNSMAPLSDGEFDQEPTEEDEYSVTIDERNSWKNPCFLYAVIGSACALAFIAMMCIQAQRRGEEFALAPQRSSGEVFFHQHCTKPPAPTTCQQEMSKLDLLPNACGDVSEELCNCADLNKFGLYCHWGGSSCLSTTGRLCGEITDSNTCDCESESEFHISCRWAGSSCLLTTGRKCGEITDKEICDENALVKFGLSCKWVGDKCVSTGIQTCGHITDADLCDRSTAGSACGWGGSACLKKAHATCSELTSRVLCNEKAPKKFGIHCEWREPNVCVAIGAKSCSDIVDEKACDEESSSETRLFCGWTGTQCLSIGGRECGDITEERLCLGAEEKFGLQCFWGGSACIPKVKYTPVGEINMMPDSGGSSPEESVKLGAFKTATVPNIGHAPGADLLARIQAAAPPRPASPAPAMPAATAAAQAAAAQAEAAAAAAAAAAQPPVTTAAPVSVFRSTTAQQELSLP